MTRRTFTLQLHDQPEHFHMCEECRLLRRCRLPRCNVVDEHDAQREDRECDRCRKDLLEQDIPLHSLAHWCEHCGADVGLNFEWQARWTGPTAPKPHHPWCLGELTDRSPPLVVMRQSDP